MSAQLTTLLREYGVSEQYIALILQSKARAENSTSPGEVNVNRGKHIRLYRRAFRYRKQ